VGCVRGGVPPDDGEAVGTDGDHAEGPPFGGLLEFATDGRD
jgi:hypothetical protein